MVEFEQYLIMSWWDLIGIFSFVLQVLKNVQKKIDKVLDIIEDEVSGGFLIVIGRFVFGKVCNVWGVIYFQLYLFFKVLLGCFIIVKYYYLYCYYYVLMF